MSTQRERDADKREQKLKDIQEAVGEGRLVIREMTPEERKKLPPREPREKPTRRRS